jgi:predicted esterase YcpF (UPF0227 family)
MPVFLSARAPAQQYARMPAIRMTAVMRHDRPRIAVLLRRNDDSALAYQRMLA